MTVTANDLYLFALTTGELYDRCCEVAKRPSERRRLSGFIAIINTAWTMYKREVGPSVIKSSDKVEAARLLMIDRVEHIKELP